MIDPQKIEKAFNDFDTATKHAGLAAAPGVAIPNPCNVWHNIRGTVQAIIDALKALGAIIPVAKRAAEVLEKLRDILNALCP